MYKIEKSVPIPELALGGVAKYPFTEMKVGDSFFVPIIEGRPLKNVAVAVSSASFKPSIKKLGYKYTVRQLKTGVRCWRVK